MACFFCTGNEVSSARNSWLLARKARVPARKAAVPARKAVVPARVPTRKHGHSASKTKCFPHFIDVSLTNG